MEVDFLTFMMFRYNLLVANPFLLVSEIRKVCKNEIEREGIWGKTERRRN